MSKKYIILYETVSFKFFPYSSVIIKSQSWIKPYVTEVLVHFLQISIQKLYHYQ